MSFLFLEGHKEKKRQRKKNTNMQAVLLPLIFSLLLLSLFLLFIYAAGYSSSSSSSSSSSQSSKKRRPCHCSFCGKEGHSITTCRDKKKNASSVSLNSKRSRAPSETDPSFPPKRVRTSHFLPFKPGMTFVVYDCETTGFTPKNSRMVQFSFRELAPNGDISSSHLSRFVNPGFAIDKNPVPEQARMVTHSHVKDSPEFYACCGEIKDYFDQLNAEEVILMAHNAPFDLRFLNFELEKAGQSLHPKIKGVVDPLTIFRSHFKNRDPKPPNHREETLHQFVLGEPLMDPHFADNDVLGLAKIMTSSSFPFLSLAKSSILPISHYLNQWEELKKKWERERVGRDPLEDSDLGSDDSDVNPGDEPDDLDKSDDLDEPGPSISSSQPEPEWKGTNYFQPRNFSGPTPGPTSPPKTLFSSFFFFWHRIRLVLLNETNLYARQEMNKKKAHHFLLWAVRKRKDGVPFKPLRMRAWKPVTKEELNHFLAILLIAGVNQRESCLQDLWSSNPALANEKVKSIMTYFRLPSLSFRISCLIPKSLNQKKTKILPDLEVHSP